MIMTSATHSIPLASGAAFVVSSSRNDNTISIAVPNPALKISPVEALEIASVLIAHAENLAGQ